MDKIFTAIPYIELEINRPTIEYLHVKQNRTVIEISELDEVIINKKRLDNLLYCLKYPFSKGEKEEDFLHNYCIRLTVEYTSQDNSIREKTLFFEYNNYILEFTIPKVSDYTNIYYLKHIHKIDKDVMKKRRLLGTEDKVLTAEQIDELLKQDKIHQII